MRILTKLQASVNSGLRRLHRIAQYPNTGDADFDSVTRNQRADASGSSRGDDIAREQRHHARNPADEIGHRINHQGGVARLAERAIYARLDQNIRWIEIGFDVRANGTKGVEPLAARELHV